MWSGCLNLWLPPQSHKVYAVGVEPEAVDGERLLVLIGRLKRNRFPGPPLDLESETSMAVSSSDSYPYSSPLSLSSELSSLSQSSFPAVSAPPDLFHPD